MLGISRMIKIICVNAIGHCNVVVLYYNPSHYLSEGCSIKLTFSTVYVCILKLFMVSFLRVKRGCCNTK